MTRALTRTTLHSSQLLRVLTDLSAVDAAQPGLAFAEKLGQWIDFSQAIALCTVHNATGASRPQGTAAARGDLGQACAQLRQDLERAITHSSQAKGVRALPAPDVVLPLDLRIAFDPYRRYYQAQQRDLETSVGPMRRRVREALAQSSPALQQLAALDACFEDILGEREGRLLATLPKLLEQRFAALWHGHQQHLAQAQQADRPALWLQAGGWLARFRDELQTVLLGELDLRLQPTLGLLDALHHHTRTA